MYYEAIALTDKARKFIKNRFKDTEMEIYPGIFNFDSTFIEFLKALQKTLHAEFSISDSDHGYFFGPPITDDFSNLLTMPGSTRPLSYGPISDVTRSTKQRVDFDLMSKYLERVMYLRYQSRVEGYGHINRNSNSGLPICSNDIEYKMQHLSLIANNLETISTLLENGDLRTLFDDYAILFAGVSQIRRQCDFWKDGKPKIRILRTLEDALNGKDGVAFSDDQLIHSSGLATCRTRVVKAFAGPINYLFTAFTDGLRNFGDSYYNFTYKHTTREHILSKLSKFGNRVGLDVTQFDGTIGWDLASRWIELFPVSKNFKRAIELLFLSPMRDTKSGFETGDPLNIDDFKYYSGLPSGIFCTSTMGKDIMSSAIFANYEKAIGRDVDLSEMSSILRGEHHAFGFLNQGDDSVILSNDDSLLESIMQCFSDSYFKIEPEKGIKFLGNVLYKENGKLNLTNALSSYFEIYVPERDINSRFRPYPMLGIKERRNIYGTHPYFLKAREIEMELFKQFFNIEQSHLEDANLKFPINPGNVMSSADIEVLNNINKIYYKFSKDDIDPAIYDIISSDVPAKIGERIVNEIQS